MKKIIILFIIFLSLHLGLMAANIDDGNKLLKDCLHAEKVMNGDRTANLTQASFCIGLISGVSSTMQIMGEDHPKIKICPPEKIPNNEQLVRITLNFLKKNPQRLHQGDNILVMMALIREFPCKK